MESTLKRNSGFTLVELVMVIIVISIISAFAISRNSNSQSYLTNIVRNQLIASGRLAQQTSLSRASTAANVSLTIRPTAIGTREIWRFSVAGGGADSINMEVDRGGEQIHFGSNLSATCSSLTAASDGAPLIIQFDGDGNRSPAQNLRICVNSDVISELCVSPAGYMYTGTCL